MKWLLPILIITLLSFDAYALYANVTFDIDDTGDTVIAGKTNYKPFTGTNNYLTSKDGNIWTLNITSPIFDNYNYMIRLPKYSAINYITANNKFTIGENGGLIAIAGSGNNKPLSVFIEYAIDKEESSSSTIYLITGVLILIVVILIMFLIRKEIAKKSLHQIKRELYTERQLLILDYLSKHKIITQAQLEKELNIPKASLSRNIKTLVQKGLIFSETKGMSNVIGLK